MTYAIETSGVDCRVGKTFEIRNLALNVPSGSIYGFLGPNGAGKTTTIQLLLALRRMQHGSITILGHSVPTDVTPVLAKTAYVPERPHLDPGMGIDEALRFHAAFYRSWDGLGAARLLEQFGLDPTRRIRRLSKGETGKLMILMALSQRPELLVLDEPTDGLDPVVRREVVESVVDYVSSTRATVFISSHLVHELERFCDWIGVMDRGSLIVEMRMEAFKNGIKRLRVSGTPVGVESAPFVVLSRQPAAGLGDVEDWVVRGWEPPMRQFFDQEHARLREVMDLDLEDGFVELLRTFRDPIA